MIILNNKIIRFCVYITCSDVKLIKLNDQWTPGYLFRKINR